MLDNHDELINAVSRHGYTWVGPLDGDSRQVGRVAKDEETWVAKKVLWQEDGRSLDFIQECAKHHLAPSYTVLEGAVLLMEDLGDGIAADEIELSPTRAKAVGAFFHELHQLDLHLPLPSLGEMLWRYQEKWIDESQSLSRDLRDKSRDLLQELTSFPDESTLHGDAHAWNLMLSSDRVWLIDPAGALGSPSFEVAYFSASIANPLEVLAATREGYAAPLPYLGQWLWWCFIFRYAVQSTRGRPFRPERNGHSLHELLERAEEIGD